ncbi:MAG TPA: alpha/beta hydrolase [Ktedonobacterales bacterium]|jgi:pimeloyl-ACP methyl ester carboxylesterase
MTGNNAITPRDGAADVRGLRLHYREWQRAEGADGRQAPILLIHGLASASRIWDLTAPLLASKGHRVVALDQRGHGESDKPDTGYTFEEIVADDHALAEQLGLEHPVVVGHSWGGGVVVQYAATHPEDVRGVVLVDGGFTQMGQRPGWTRERMLKDLAPPQFAGTPAETFLGFGRRGELGKVWTPAHEEIVLNIVQLRPDGTVAPRLSLANHLQILEAMWDQPTLSLYDRITCPILIICPEQEPTDDRTRQFLQVKREGIAKLLDQHPGIRVEYLENTIHDVPLQRPALLADLIEGLAQ